MKAPTPLNKPAVTAATLMIAAGGLFAVSNTLVQHATMVAGVAPTRVAFWQYLFACLFLLPVIVKLGVSALRTNRPLAHILRVALAAIGVQLWVVSLAHVPIWQAISLIMLSPFFVTLGASLVLGETASAQRWIAVTTGFIGGLIILAPWSHAFTLAALLPVAAAAMWAFSSLLTKHLAHSESPASLTIYLLVLLTPINAVLALDAGLAPVTGNLGYVVLATGLLTACAQYALAKAYSLTDAAYLQPFDHIKLPLNVALGMAVFGFAPPGSMWIGSMLIVASSFYLLDREARISAA